MLHIVETHKLAKTWTFVAFELYLACVDLNKIGMGEGVAFPRTGFGNLLHKFNTFDFPRKGGGGLKIRAARCPANISKLKKNITTQVGLTEN